MWSSLSYSVPSPAQIGGLAGVVATTFLFALLGRLVSAHRGLPEASVFAGWAVLASTLTVFGTVASAPLSYAFWPLVGLAAAFGTWAAFRGRLALPADGLRVAVLGLPLLAILAGKWPSEVDTFTHWLPNALYLVENDLLPGPGRPEPWSRFPGFPYNFTFVSYVASRFVGYFVANGAILFNVVLLLLYAVLVARLVLRGGGDARGRVGWPLAALGLLLATLANPVFVRRILFISYPDTATAITLAYAGVLAWLWLDALAERTQDGNGLALQLVLALVLLVNLKQANLVLFVALVASILVVMWRDPRIEAGRSRSWIAAMIVAPLAMYGIWRLYLAGAGTLGENKLLPVDKWPVDSLPKVLWLMGVVALKKSGYFAMMLFFVVYALRAVRHPRTSFDRLAMLVGGVFVAYTLFLIFIYIAHFGGWPQSYWRFNTHLGYFGFAAAAYGGARLWRRWGRPLPDRRLGIAAVALVLVLEFALLRYWRFDLEQPKPMLRRTGIDMAESLPRNAKVVALIPGDNGNFSWILRYYVTIDRPDLSVITVRSVAAAREQLARTGPPVLVWSYCGTAEMEMAFGLSLPGTAAVLLARDGSGWRLVRRWPHPPIGGLLRYAKGFDPRVCARASGADASVSRREDTPRASATPQPPFASDAAPSGGRRAGGRTGRGTIRT